LDAHTALQDVETVAVSNLQAAADKHDNLTVNVATPVPDVALEQRRSQPQIRDAVIRDAAAEQGSWIRSSTILSQTIPRSGNLQLDTGANQPADSAKKFDCFYLPLNYVPQIDMTTILNLDPFIDADPSFDRNERGGRVLAQVQRDNKTWALAAGDPARRSEI